MTTIMWHIWHIYFVNETMKISDVKTNKWQNDAVQITTLNLTKIR